MNISLFDPNFALAFTPKTYRNMSAFTIYAIVLTLAYVIYYSAMITKEAYARKDQGSDTTETFDIGGMNDQIESVTVNESKDGFYLGDPDTDDGDNVNEESITEMSDEDQVSVEGKDPELPSQAEQRAATVGEMMEEITAEYSDEFEPDEFDAVLLNPANTVPVIITMDTRDKL